MASLAPTSDSLIEPLLTSIDEDITEVQKILHLTTRVLEAELQSVYRICVLPSSDPKGSDASRTVLSCHRGSLMLLTVCSTVGTCFLGKVWQHTLPYSEWKLYIEVKKTRDREYEVSVKAGSGMGCQRRYLQNYCCCVLDYYEEYGTLVSIIRKSLDEVVVATTTGTIVHNNFLSPYSYENMMEFGGDETEEDFMKYGFDNSGSGGSRRVKKNRDKEEEKEEGPVQIMV